ncbi:hypothetical protein D3C85_1355970 [compost metagenome]
MIVSADVLDGTEVILRGDLADWDQLNAVLLPIRGVHEQVAKIARAFAALHCIAKVGNEILVLRGVGHIENETGVTAVLVILAAEQCGAFIEQRALQGRQPLGQPVDFLVDVRHPQVAHTTWLEFVLVLPALHLVVGVQVNASAHVLR